LPGEGFLGVAAEKSLMCELMGVSYAKPGHPEAYFRDFRAHEPENPDGWGLACYPDRSALLFKEPVGASTSLLADYLQNRAELKSQIFIAHIRKASQENTKGSYANTHPFLRELEGRDYLFAHNGNLDNFADLPLETFHPLGDTDSEHAFCYLMGRLALRKIGRWQPADFGLLWKIFQRINRLGYFNCLFSDGEFLFSYCDYEAEFQGKLKGLHLLHDESGCIVSSLPLGSGNWERYKLGELKIFQAGKLIFSRLP